MPWDPSAPTNPKYRTPEYRRESARLKAEYERTGWTECRQPECIETTRHIRWPAPVHTLHDETGLLLIGLGHPRCNLHHAAMKGNAISRGITAEPMRWPR